MIKGILVCPVQLKIQMYAVKDLFNRIKTPVFNNKFTSKIDCG